MRKALTAHHPDHFGERICEALGLDPGRVQEITLHIPLDGFVTVTVRQMVEHQYGENLLSELAEDNLVKTDTTEGGT